MSQYLTVKEFKQAPTAIDTSNLDQSAIGNSQAQDSALLNVIRRASSWVDNICMLNTLEATTTTELKEVHVGKSGRLNIHVDNTPILSLTNISYRLYPGQDYIAIDPSFVQVFDNWFSVYQFNSDVLSPNLQLQPWNYGYTSPYSRQLISDTPLSVKYTYKNGYMNTTLTNAAVIGDTVIQLVNPDGAYEGLRFTIFDGASEENCEVLSVSGDQVTLKRPLMFAHDTDVSVSALPASIKQATLLLTSYLIKERGSLAVTMNETVVSGTAMSYNKNSDIEIAKELLRPFIRRVVT